MLKARRQVFLVFLEQHAKVALVWIAGAFTPSVAACSNKARASVGLVVEIGFKVPTAIDLTTLDV